MTFQFVIASESGRTVGVLALKGPFTAMGSKMPSLYIHELSLVSTRLSSQDLPDALTVKNAIHSPDEDMRRALCLGRRWHLVVTYFG